MAVPLLQQPLEMRGVRIPNRVVSTAHGTLLAGGSGVSMSDRGVPGSRLARYHEARALGGAGLIITEPTVVFPYSERWMAGWRETVDRVTDAGAVIFNQLIYGGRGTSGAEHLRPPYAPSAIPAYPGADPPQEMGAKHIGMMVRSFAHAASEAARAGFRGVELHGAHGYLFHGFMSPHANHRTDTYGGPIGNRIRFPVEVLTACREAIGDDMVLGMRFSGEEELADGLHADESLEMIRLIAATGLVDYISVSGGSDLAVDRMIPSMWRGRGVNVGLAAQLREMGVTTRILVTGRIVDPAMADQIIGDGHADLVGMTRALIADPEMPRKAFAGRLDDVRYCMGANEGCWGRVKQKYSVGCVLNPTVGAEAAPVKPKTEGVGRIAVVGGGPAGAEAARHLAARGYDVSVFEERTVLGGQIAIAAKAAGREDLTEVARWHGHELDRLGVPVHFGRSPDLTDFTHAVLATGSRPVMPPDVEVDWLTTEQAIDLTFDPGELVVIWSVSERIDPLSVAFHLEKVRGKRRIVVATPHELVSRRLDDSTRASVLGRLVGTDITVLPGVDLHREGSDKVTLAPRWGGQPQTFADIDTLVLDYGWEARPFDGPIPASLKVSRVGDCLSPRGLQAAVWDGAKVGRSL
jgi:2,4-dienoyl-CoA reductase-like NADH-dependent reductase (Old Yellow Enzyme family)